ncbi:MAG: carboxypeptidase-like regulatory domain-containing protein [Pirellula sp.]
MRPRSPRFFVSHDCLSGIALTWIGVLAWLAPAMLLSTVKADEPQPSEEVIAGRVVDASNQPIVGAKVQWMTDFFKDCIVTESDAEGQFQIRQAVPADGGKAAAREDLLWVVADGFNLKCVRPQRSDGRFLPSLVSLSAATTLQVQVFSPDGSPCANAIVEPYYFDIPNGV